MKKVLKWLGIILAGIVGLVIILSGIAYLLSSSRMNKTYAVTVAPVMIPSDSASLEEGKRLFVTRGCPDCHGSDGAGAVLLDTVMVGRFAGPNLTAGEGGIGGELTDTDWVRAIRHGLGPDLKPILVMPSNEYNPMNDRDLGALVAYVKNLPPVDKASIDTQLGPLGRALLVANQAALLSAEHIDHNASRPVEVPVGPTVEYGKYLAVSCIGCHGTGLSGGPIPGDPSGPPHPSNLTPHPQSGLGDWTEADFVTAIRQGVRPDGTALADKMPWKGFSQMNDVELKALWLYLQSLPAQAYGNR
jgi:mono/diheme cytochrome c family protein